MVAKTEMKNFRGTQVDPEAREDLVARGKEFVAAQREAGKALSYRAWADAGYAPTLPVLVRRFGSWNAFLAECGADVKVRTGYRRDRVSEETAVAHVQEFLDDPEVEYGGAQWYERWARENGRTSLATVRTRLGSWAEAKERALALAN